MAKVKKKPDHKFWEGSDELKFKIIFAEGGHKIFEESTEPTLKLMSWLNEKKGLIRMIEAGHKIFVDCGAYTAHTQGKVVDMDSYLEFVNEYDYGVEIYASVDFIPGVYRMPKTKADLDEAPIKTWENYLYMREHSVSPHKALPIFHQGEDFKYLEQMLETTFDGEHIPYIGISPANDLATKLKEPWIAKCFKIIKASSNPDVKTHAFGMTALPLLEKFPFTSADSMSWLFLAVNGKIMSRFGALIISDSVVKGVLQKVTYKYRDNAEVIKALNDDFESKGFTMEEIKTDSDARLRWNICYLMDWARNYKMVEPRKQKSLF